MILDRPRKILFLVLVSNALLYITISFILLVFTSWISSIIVANVGLFLNIFFLPFCEPLKGGKSRQDQGEAPGWGHHGDTL